MAVEKNIVMKEFNGTDYDTLYPKTIGTQVDGIFTSEQTLTSNTLAKYQLSASAVPDDVFAFLGKYAQYWWRRRSIIFEPNVATSETRIYFANGYVDPNTVYYSTEIDSTSDGKPVLKNPQSLVVPAGTSSGALTILQNANLGGKYVTNILYRASVEVSDEVYLLPSNPSFQFDSGLPYTIPAYKVTLNKTFGDWEYVQSNNRNAYPDGESFGYVVDLSHTFNDVYITNAYETRTIYYSSDIGFDSEGTPYLVGETSLSINYNSGTDIFNLLKGKYIRNIWFSNATSADIYFVPAEKTVRPDNGYVVANMAAKVGSKFVPLPPEDGYQYEYLGVPFDNLPMASSVEIGNYAGTGTYGQNNPNTLTFSKKPKLIILGPTNTGGGSVTAGTDNTCIILFGITTSFVFGSSDSINHISYSENTMSWYNDNSATYQQNYQHYKYYYIVIY